MQQSTADSLAYGKSPASWPLAVWAKYSPLLVSSTKQEPNLIIPIKWHSGQNREIPRRLKTKNADDRSDDDGDGGRDEGSSDGRSGQVTVVAAVIEVM